MSPLDIRLAALAAAGQTITYGALARQLSWRMGALTAALEATMEADAAANLPFRAAVMEARLTPGLPAKGFYDKALQLGLEISDEAAFARSHRAALFAAAQAAKPPA